MRNLRLQNESHSSVYYRHLLYFGILFRGLVPLMSLEVMRFKLILQDYLDLSVSLRFIQMTLAFGSRIRIFQPDIHCVSHWNDFHLRSRTGALGATQRAFGDI